VLSDLAYLWSHRERPDAPRRVVVVWAKRLLLLPQLAGLLYRATLARMRGAVIGDLVIVGKARFQGPLSNLEIGAQSSLGRCALQLHAVIRIGRRVVINDGAMLVTASHDLKDPHWRQVAEPITIGDYAWIASGAIVLPGTHIGRGAVVAAGAVVKGRVPDNAVVLGNPAQVRDSARSLDLDYSPVMLNAPFEAWVGHKGSHDG
jgi:acetyltransferase-like isoleucine patch superfamily enzyme